MNRSQTAVLVVDVQRGLFCTDPPPFDAEAVVARINAVMDRARAAGVPVILVQHDGPADGDWLVPFTDQWQLHPDLRLTPADLLIRKTTGDAFQGTGLERELRSRGIQTILLMGFATDFCIDATLHSAASKGFEVLVAADAHTTEDSPVLTASVIRDHYNWVWANSLGIKPIRTIPADDVHFH